MSNRESDPGLPSLPELEEIKAALDSRMIELFAEASKQNVWDLENAMKFARLAYLKGKEDGIKEMIKAIDNEPDK